MPAKLPALALMANPGDRRATLDIARETERRGFAGISVSSSFGNMSQCVGLAFATQRIPFATAIAPIYAQAVDEFAQNTAYLHEVSGGRFQFGIGIAHAPAYFRFEVKPGKPLGDTRAFIEKFKAHSEYGPLPPVIVATLRKRMIALAGEIGDGLIFANGSRTFMPDSLSALPEAKRHDPCFFIGNRVRTCVSDDVAEAKAALRRSMAGYWLMPQLPQLLEADRVRAGNG
jgi:alkanesulfonate monooxygenase SsuD/methylene tetrahydromethanopterin reductase-like flavin-dependent oxidoreductase (luciferase family)